MTKSEVARMCVACRQVKEKSGLIRVVRNADGTLEADATGRKDGRGAYVCANVDCIRLARKKGAFSRAFRREVKEELYQRLERMVQNDGP